MRLYSSLEEALSEIQRDLSKSPRLVSTRVQQRTGENLPGRETIGYSYAIEAEGIPTRIADIISLGQQFRMEPYFNEIHMTEWLTTERNTRFAGVLGVMTEVLHPALNSTIEGNWPAYTYGERLSGAIGTLGQTLIGSPDSRRAFWPIFQPQDSRRAMAPTRIPCSLGYQVLIRQTIDGPRVILYYLQRSADFDNFLLSDIWLAHEFQREVAGYIDQIPGQFMHTIVSLHSFAIEGTEVY